MYVAVATLSKTLGETFLNLDYPAHFQERRNSILISKVPKNVRVTIGHYGSPPLREVERPEVLPESLEI